MKPVIFKISPEMLDTYPDVEVAAIRVTIQSKEKLIPLIAELKESICNIREELNNIEPITALPEISTWREAYSAMGVKPSKFHSSIEALLRRVKKGHNLDTGLPIVDFYNLVSVIQRAPIGAYDAGKLDNASIILRKANPNFDNFNPLGGSSDAFPLNSKLVVYGSGNDILCWGFNTRDSKTVSVDKRTNEALFFSEATSKTSPKPEVVMEFILEQLKSDNFEVGEIQIFNASKMSGKI